MASIAAHFIDTSAETYIAAGELYRRHLQKEAEKNSEQNLGTRKRLAQKLCLLRNKMRQRAKKSVAEMAALVCARHLFNIHRRTNGIINRLKRDCLEFCLDLCRAFVTETDSRQREILAQQIKHHLDRSADPSKLTIVLRSEDLPNVQTLLTNSNVNFLTAADLEPGSCEIRCASASVVINWRRNLETISSKIRAYAQQKYPD